MLKENINTKWPVYRDRVVRQLVGETEIDFKNSRVRLEAAEYSFPFYSFGARRAYPENLISEPNSNFGKYVISNYGVDETEYKEIYAMYMGIIASRLQDHDENVNHLHLHESTDKQHQYLNKIVDQLTSTTIINDDGVMSSPFKLPNDYVRFPYPHLSVPIPSLHSFHNQMVDIYGLSHEEILYVWKRYRENIIYGISGEIPPEYDFYELNESVVGKNDDEVIGKEFWFEYHCFESPESCDAEAWYRSHQKVIVLERGYDDHDQYPDEHKVYKVRFEDRLEYDVFDDELMDSPEEFYRPDPPLNPLNESKQIDYLDKVVEYLVYDSKDDKLPFDNSYISFNTYIKNIYGITDKEVDYVYFKYRYLVGWDEVRRYNEYLPESLNESTEDNFLNTIVDQLVSETEIDYEENKMKAPFLYTYGRYWFSFPLPYSIFVPVTTQFFNHCRDVYGITNEEIRYVWKNYESIILDKLKRIEPLNESIEDNALNTIVDQLVNETNIDYDKERVFAPTLLSPNPLLFPLFFSSLTFPFSFLFFDHCRDMYGLTIDETEYVWVEYRKTIKDKIKNKPLNESTEDNALNTIVDQLMDETDIDYGRKLVLTPFWVRPFSFPFSIASRSFIRHCRDIYGLNDPETQYVWEEYKKIIKDKIKNKPLNESIEDNALNTIVDQLVNETDVDYGTETVFAPFISTLPSPFFSSFHTNILPFSHLPLPSTFAIHCNTIYGITYHEIDYIWDQYKSIISDKIKNKPLNESIEDNFLDTIVDQLVGESKIDYEKNVVYPPYPSTHDPYNFYPPYYYDTPDLFAIHCRDIYGLTEPEIEYVWEEYKQIITDKIHSISFITESTEDNALNTIVYQLVNETDIDYGTETVFAHFFLIPFHNLHYYLPLPSTFARHCRSIYGVTYDEIDYIWDQYKSIMIDKIKDKPLNESTEDKLEDKQNAYIKKVIRHMVEDSFIDNSHPEISQWGVFAPHMDRWISPFGFLSPNDRHRDAFEKYVRDIYGVEYEEVGFAWKDYLTTMQLIIYDLGGIDYDKGDYEPSSHLTESREYNFLNTIVYQLVGETIIDHEQEEIILPHHSYPLLYHTLPVGLLLPARYGPIFFKHCRDIYGITEDEIQYVWGKYINILKDEIENQSLNESAENKFLDTIVDQLVEETGIDYEKNAVYNYSLFSSSIFYLPSPLSPTPLAIFSQHCSDIYGLTEPEIEYVWIKYKSILVDKIKNKPLNESYFDKINNPQQHKFFNRIADDLMDSIEEIINIQHDDEPLELLLNMGNVDHPDEGFYLHTPGGSYPEYLNQNKDADDFTYEIFKKIMDNYTMDILNTIQNKWGLDRMDGLFIMIYFFLPKLWNKYYKQDKPSQSLIYSPSSLNESVEDNTLNSIINKLVGETIIDYEENKLYHPFSPASRSFSLPSSFFLFTIFFHHSDTLFNLFFDHCRDIYGLTDPEIEYVWIRYKSIIKDKIESKVSLNESHYTPKYYAPKWGVRRENDFLDRIVDGLVEESIIEYVEEIVHLANFSFQLFKGPFADLYSIPETSPFYQHCMDVYGLTPEEITYVWTEYRNIVRQEMQSSPLSNLISPFNESVEDNTLNTIVDQLVDESKIDYDTNAVYFSDFPVPFNPLNLIPLPAPSLFADPFYEHGREVYGLTPEEITYVWGEYKKEILKKIESKGSLNESTEDDFLDKIVNQLMDETIMNYEDGGISYPHHRSCWYYMEYTIPNHDFFKNYIINLYGLTKEEANYIWEKYNNSIRYKIDNNKGGSLNESTGKNFLGNIINKLVYETKLGEKMVVFGDMRAPFNHFPAIRSTEYFIRHCKDYYGLTENEIDYVWKQYKQIIEYKIKSQTSLNENMDKQYKFLEWVISDVKNKTYMQIHERPVIGGFYSTHPLHFIDPIDREDSVWRFMYKHYETYYGLTMDEMFYVVERVYPWVAETFLTDYSND